MASLFRFLARLPLPLLHNLGALCGWAVWLLSPTYRRHLRANTALAGLAAARRGAIAEAGKAMLELPAIWLRPQDEVVERVVKVSGWETVEEAWKAGRGILFLTPHLGCFEIAAQYYATHQPITVLYRRPKQDWLAAMVEEGRGANLRLATADTTGVKKLLKALKAGEAIGLLPDQAPGAGEGVWAPFFGKPAYTMTLAPRLARMEEGGGATVLLAWAERLHYGAGYHLKLRRPAEPLTDAAAVNRAIEGLIRERPEQYLWGYNRYKKPSGAPEPGEAA